MKIDRNLPNVKQTYKKVFWRHVFGILVTFILLLFYFIFRCQLYAPSNSFGVYSLVLGCLFVIISACTNHMLIIEFTCSVCVINERFRDLRVTVANSAVLQGLTHNIQTSDKHSVNARKMSVSPLKTELEVAVKLHTLLCNAACLECCLLNPDFVHYGVSVRHDNIQFVFLCCKFAGSK
jgi:hypothetical protein